MQTLHESQRYTNEEERVIYRSHVSDILEGVVLNDVGESVVRGRVDESNYEVECIMLS